MNFCLQITNKIHTGPPYDKDSHPGCYIQNEINIITSSN